MKGVKGILLMAGQGTRFGDPLPKQFHELANKPIYLWTLERFIDSKLFEEIILVCSPDRSASVRELVGARATVITGGSTRQESSYKALQACGPTTEIVLIHDAVRPFISERILRENVEKAAHVGAINTCISSQDTVVYAPTGIEIEEIPPRDAYLRGQTPQTFSYPLLLEAHEKTTHTDASDDCQLLLSQNQRVYVVEGNEQNLKITTKLDLFLAEEMMKNSPLLTNLR